MEMSPFRSPSVCGRCDRPGKLAAEMCGSGGVERLVGQASAARRDEVFLASKVLPLHASRRASIRACEESLLRLKTNRLDCYLLRYRGRSPLEETIAAFEQLRREGKILSWGVSNFDVSDLEEVWNSAAEIVSPATMSPLSPEGTSH
jgi:diketogulonate reductase-like aldo/keto reductase